MSRRLAVIAIVFATAASVSGCAELYRSFGPPEAWKSRQVTFGISPRTHYYGLLSKDANIEHWSILGLARRGDAESVPGIALALKPGVTPSPLVRSTAAVALAMLGDPRAIPHLEEACKDPSPLVRADAVDALGALGGPAQTPMLARVLASDRDARVRLHAARALARLGGREAVAALIAHLGDADESVSFECRRSLATISGRDLAPRTAVWTEWMEENT